MTTTGCGIFVLLNHLQVNRVKERRNIYLYTLVVLVVAAVRLLDNELFLFGLGHYFLQNCNLVDKYRLYLSHL